MDRALTDAKQKSQLKKIRKLKKKLKRAEEAKALQRAQPAQPKESLDDVISDELDKKMKFNKQEIQARVLEEAVEVKEEKPDDKPAEVIAPTPAPTPEPSPKSDAAEEAQELESSEDESVDENVVTPGEVLEAASAKPKKGKHKKGDYGAAYNELYTQLSMRMLNRIFRYFQALYNKCDTEGQFKRKLAGIQKWNQLEINRRAKEIVNLYPDTEQLFRYAYAANVLVISVVVAKDENSEDVEIEVPKFSNFIQRCYIESARAIYDNVGVLSPELPDKDRLAIRTELYRCYGNAIATALRMMVPLDLIAPKMEDAENFDEIAESSEGEEESDDSEESDVSGVSDESDSDSDDSEDSEDSDSEDSGASESESSSEEETEAFNDAGVKKIRISKSKLDEDPFN